MFVVVFLFFLLVARDPMQPSGPDHDPERTRILRSRFSAWTPLGDKRRNLQVRLSDDVTFFSRDHTVRSRLSDGLQLFEDRVDLVLRWFDLWTDRQRKQLMWSLLVRCTSSQLRWVPEPPRTSSSFLRLRIPSGAAEIC